MDQYSAAQPDLDLLLSLTVRGRRKDTEFIYERQIISLRPRRHSEPHTRYSKNGALNKPSQYWLIPYLILTPPSSQHQDPHPRHIIELSQVKPKEGNELYQTPVKPGKMPYFDSNSRPPSPEPAPAPPPNSPRDGVTRLAKAFRDGGGPIGDKGVICLGDSFCIREGMNTAIFHDNSKGGRSPGENME